MRPGSAYKLGKPSLMSAAGRTAMSHSSPRQPPTNRIRFFSDGTSVFLERSAEERLANPDSLVVERYNLASLPILKAPEPTIVKLSYAFNKIAHLSDSLLKLPNLQYLDLSSNKLEKLEGISMFCQELRVLKARNCAIKQLNDIRHCTKLQYLDLADNKLEGSLSIDNSCFPRGLQFLSLRNNELTSIACTKTAFTGLTELNLSGNKIGKINIDPVLLPRLEKLDLGGNALYDPQLLTPLLQTPQLRLIVIKHNAFCLSFEPLFTTRISNQQIIQAFSDAFNRLSGIANNCPVASSRREDASQLLLADFGDFRSYFVLRYADPKRGIPQLSFSDAKIEKASVFLKNVHSLHTVFSFPHYAADGVLQNASPRRPVQDMPDDSPTRTPDKRAMNRSNQNIVISDTDDETYSYYSTDTDEQLEREPATRKNSTGQTKIPRPASEGAVQRHNQSFNSKAFINDAATLLMKKFEVGSARDYHQTSVASKQSLSSSNSFVSTSKSGSKRRSRPSAIPTIEANIGQLMATQGQQEPSIPPTPASLFTPALFRTPKDPVGPFRSSSPLSVLTRPSVTGTPLFLGKEVRELDLDASMTADVCDTIESVDKDKKRADRDDQKGQGLFQKAGQGRRDKSGCGSSQIKGKSAGRQRPTSANNLSYNRSSQSTTTLQPALSVMKQGDQAFIKTLKMRGVNYKMFPKRTKEGEDTIYEFTRLSNFYRLTEGTSGYLTEDISRQPHGGIYSAGPDNGTGSTGGNKDIAPMLELRPRRGREIREFDNPVLSQEYEVFVAGVQDPKDIDLVGPLSTLLFKMLSKDPELFTMPSISIKEVNLVDVGYEAADPDVIEDAENGKSGLIVVPIKISTETMQSDVNYLTGNFIQSLSFFRCTIDFSILGRNPDLVQFIESIELLSCGISTLAQMQFIALFQRLRGLVIYDDITKRPHFRAMCLYYCPTLEIINDTPVSDMDWARVNILIKRYGNFVPTPVQEVGTERDSVSERQASQMMRQITASVDGIRRNMCCSTWIQFRATTK